MRRFVLKFLFFISTTIILAFLIDYFLSINLKKSKSFAAGEYTVWNDIFSGNVNSDVVIYGSSSAWVDFDVKMLTDSLKRDTYGLGIDGHNFWLQYLRHKELLKYNRAPKYIIYSIDIGTLQKRDDLYNSEQFLPYMLFNKDIYEYTSSYKGFSLLDYIIPLSRYSGKIEANKCSIKNSFIRNGMEFGRIKGFLGKNEEWNNDLDKAKSKMKYYEIKLDNESIEKFKKFLLECRDKNIKIIFVNAPGYIEGQEFVKDRDKIISLYKNIAKDNNIAFLNYDNDSICMQKKYFYNSFHLNISGAEVFTSKLIKDLKNNNLIPSIDDREKN